MQKTSLPVNYRRVGSMDQSVWWDEEMAAGIVCCIALLQEVVSYTVKQYCLELKNAYFKIVTCIIEMMYYYLFIRF
jgi:hypothetical protein